MPGPITGAGELVFSAQDFGNFLVHPLTRVAAATNGTPVQADPGLTLR